MSDALDPNYIPMRLVLECKLKSAEAKLEAAERALEMVAPGLLASQDGAVYGSILELGARATVGSNTIQNALLKALDELRATLAPKIPSYRHVQESNYDRGMSHGLSTALNEIEKLVNLINKGE